METKKLKIVIVIAAIASIIGGLVYVLISNVKQEENVNISPKKVEAVIEELIDWEKRHEINPEFKGQIKFESQLLKENVVQGKDNEKYLALSWDLEETSQGSIFMDYRNHIEDQNLILYGHYVYKDENAKFGPLSQLIEEKNYEKNKYIELEIEEEKRKYEIAYVYYYEMGNPLMEYFHTNYDNEYFEVYKEKVKEQAFYETGIEIAMEDKLLTLQTCVRDRDDLRLVVIAREI
ncbi:MAG: class B sortase [Anaerorhabdus sp.]